MAAIASFINKCTKCTYFTVNKLLTNTSINVQKVGNQEFLPWVSSPWQLSTQVRTRYIDWRMRRDVKRRQMVKEFAPMRLRVNALRRNKTIPREIMEIADKEIAEFPRDACLTRVVKRCVLTSRPRGVVLPHRLSRIMWRLLADYNKLSGVIRAKW